MAGHTLPRIGGPAGATPARATLAAPSSASFPLAAGVLLGLGVGGFFDGIVFRQILQVAGWWWLRRAQAVQRPLRQADGAMLATGSAPPEPGQDVNLASESVAGEEDPGASLDMAVGAPAPGSGRSSSGSGATGSGPVSQPPPAMNPGDEAPAGTPGTGENLCRECGGSGRLAGGASCPACGGTGKVTVGVGGA